MKEVNCFFSNAICRKYAVFTELLVLALFVLMLKPAHAVPLPLTDQTCLIQAYPQSLQRVTEEGNIHARDGTLFIFDKKLPSHSHKWLLEHSDLKSQFSQKYDTSRQREAPKQNLDPGRLRSEELFLKIYGATQDRVSANLEKIIWAPCGCSVLFNKNEGASAALQKVGEALNARPELRPYLSKPIGTMNWRKISGSSRLSMHAYGVAIDFSLPSPLHAYWRWSGCREDEICKYPEPVLKDDNLAEIVQIFESHGFIWGGKWHHFDTMHFEYRPELVGKFCGKNEK